MFASVFAGNRKSLASILGRKTCGEERQQPVDPKDMIKREVSMHGYHHDRIGMVPLHDLYDRSLVCVWHK